VSNLCSNHSWVVAYKMCSAKTRGPAVDLQEFSKNISFIMRLLNRILFFLIARLFASPYRMGSGFSFHCKLSIMKFCSFRCQWVPGFDGGNSCRVATSTPGICLHGMDRDSLYLYVSVRKYFISLNEMFRH
jgi:hypothetical protein